MRCEIGYVTEEVMTANVPLRHKIRVGLRIADEVLDYPPCDARYFNEEEFDQVNGKGSFEETLRFYEQVWAGEN